MRRYCDRVYRDQSDKDIYLTMLTVYVRGPL
jgi:hypothetical protein